MAGRAESGAQSDARAGLVRLGHLCFDDFLIISAETLKSGRWTDDMIADWKLATNNVPHVALRFESFTCRLQTANCKLDEGPPSLADVGAAQKRLAAHFAYELLRAKAPPLYDSLPWHDWDFSIVAKRFKLWQTRILLSGDGTAVTMCRCRKTAGVYVVEPDETIARYTERKAEIEKVRRFRLLPPSSSSPSPQPLAPIPLPDASVDLAIIGSVPSLDADALKLVIDELIRVAANVLLIENNPIIPPLDESSLTDASFHPDSVTVSGLGPRRCWWKQA